MAQVAITFNSRTYRFQCGEGDVARLQKLADYVKGKLDALSVEHGTIGDERLVLMTALTIADELFDARADIDELLDGATEKLKAVVAKAGGSAGAAAASRAADEDDDPQISMG